MRQAHLVLNLPQTWNKSLSKELWFFYLINPLVCTQSPITAFTPSPGLMSHSMLKLWFFIPGYSHPQCHGITAHHAWTLMLIEFWLLKSCCTFCSDRFLTLLRFWHPALDQSDNCPLSHYRLYLALSTNSFQIKILRRGRHLHSSFNWSIKILWAFERRKCSASTV